MPFKVIENSPIHNHTVSEEETVFLASVEGRDYYYRENVTDHNIDIRYSSKPSDYVTWTMQTVANQYKVNDEFENVIPLFVFKRAFREMKFERRD